MGRDVKRVAAGFVWPLNQLWDGFVCPITFPDCADCGGGGRTKSLEAFESIVSLLMIAGGDSTRGKEPHPYFRSTPVRDVGSTLHELTGALAGRAPWGLMGHGDIDRWNASAKIIKAAGLPEGWGLCETCDGHGDIATAEERDAQENWEHTEPPTGEWYQVWETVSEGSPITPAFATPEECAQWITTPGNCRWMGSTGYEKWLKFIGGEGWAPSAMTIGGKMVDPVVAFSD